MLVCVDVPVFGKLSQINRMHRHFTLDPELVLFLVV